MKVATYNLSKIVRNAWYLKKSQPSMTFSACLRKAWRNDNDGPDRGPHVGDRADFGILSDTNDRRRQLLRRTGSILRRLRNSEILA